MAKVKVTTLVCDGCGSALEEGAEGSAKVRAEVVGETFIRNIDLCAECVSGHRLLFNEDGSPVMQPVKDEAGKDTKETEQAYEELHGGLPMGTTRAKRGTATETPAEEAPAKRGTATETPAEEAPAS